MKKYLLILVCSFVGIHAPGQDNMTAAIQPDTLQLTETFNEEDIPENEYLIKVLQPVRKNFKRINSTHNWTRINKKDLWKSGEGGTAQYYYRKGRLEKIVTRQYGETYQQLTEYYLLKGQLSFVFEKSYRYNRPIYYDSTAMRGNKDTEAFEFERSQILEERSYFDKGKLLHQVNNQDCGSPFTRDYLTGEEKRIKEEFYKLLQLEHKK